MCVRESVCVSVRNGRLMPMSKTVKVTVSTCDVPVPGDSTDKTFKNVSKRGRGHSRNHYFFGWGGGYNANISKIVKATDFKFDTHVSRPGTVYRHDPLKFSKSGRCQCDVTHKFLFYYLFYY